MALSDEAKYRLFLALRDPQDLRDKTVANEVTTALESADESEDLATVIEDVGELTSDVEGLTSDVEGLTASAPTRIAADGNLTGTYPGDVYCEGDASVTGDVVIEGNLFSGGTITNPSQYDFSVGGNAFVQTLEWNDPEKVDYSPLEAGAATVLSVGGNLRFSTINWYGYTEYSPELTVGGDLIGFDDANIFVLGWSDLSPGGTVSVRGNISGVDQLSISGAAGGTGGTLACWGSARIATLYALGGDVAGGGEWTDEDGGDGGTITIGGTFTGSIDVTGGASYIGNGGEGGTITLEGDACVTALAANGGACNTPDPDYSSGAGGHIDCGGNCSGAGTVYAAGGARGGGGTVEATTAQAGEGGTINVDGNFTASYVDASGGGVSMDDPSYPGGGGGDGGSITVHGNFFCLDLVTACGGGNASEYNDASEYGGDGGSIEVFGHASLHRGAGTWGGAGGPTAGVGGSPGPMDFHNGGHIGTIIMTPGTGGGGTGAGVTALRLQGNFNIRYIGMGTAVGNLITCSDHAYANANQAIFLKLGEMEGKQTLNKAGGTPTASIAALIDAYVFTYSGDTDLWYKFQGTDVGA